MKKLVKKMAIIKRRVFRYSLIFPLILMMAASSCSTKEEVLFKLISAQDAGWILDSANVYLEEMPTTVTAASCERSAGGLHDFYSEGDYWWPDPDNPDGPYIRRDGETNPENFTAHRQAMRRMSFQTAALVSAYLITDDDKYAKKAMAHYRSWFIDPETRMTPHMAYAQAISGRVTGRGVGLIDGIHFVEPVKALMKLKERGQVNEDEYAVIQNWFNDFTAFMTTHEYGIDERERKNNHGSCWVMQAAQFAEFTGNDTLINYCIDRFKNVLLPNQLDPDGSFPRELDRTKPYGYSLFNLDALGIVTHILNAHEPGLWTFSLDEGQSMKTALAYMQPYIADKDSWPLSPDVMYWDEWPLRHPALLFGGISLDDMDLLDLWKSLPALPATDEGLRNFPLRFPLLWIN